MSLLSVKEQVESVLATVPESRNSDVTLTVEIWKAFHGSSLREAADGTLWVDTRHLYDLPREDHVKRIRAQIQNDERRYLPTDFRILVERAKLSKEWQAFLGYQVYWKDTDWETKLKEYLVREEEERQGLLF